MDNERGKISEDVRSDDKFNEQADSLAEKCSPDEIREMQDKLGDPSEVAEKYKDAVFGDHPEWSDKERSENIEAAKNDWEGDTAAREIYGMALERQESLAGEDVIDPPIIPDQVDDRSDSTTDGEESAEPPIVLEQQDENFESVSDSAEDVEPPIISEVNDTGSQPEPIQDANEPVEPLHWSERGGNEMTEGQQAETEAVIETTGEGSAEQLDTWATNEAEVSAENMNADSAGTSESNENIIDADKYLEEGQLPPEERIEGYREEIGHNDLADIEMARELQNAEIMAGQSRKETTAGNSLDAAEAAISWATAKSQIEANNEMADKMVEYTIAQGHKADYTDNYR